MSYPYSDIIGLHRCIIDLSGRWPASWSCLSINASRFTGWILMALMHAGFVQMAFAVTYNTISNGPWTSTSTWQGGVVPGATINAVDVVNVTHEVSYTNSNDLRILGTLNIFGGGLITPGNSSRNITVQSGGELNMNDACLEFSANFNNENGSLNIENSYIEIGQNFEDKSNAGSGSIDIHQCCMYIGENFKNKGSVCQFNAFCLELGLNSSGSFLNEHQMTFRGDCTIKLNSSGNFENKGTIAGGAGSPDIGRLQVSAGNLVNDGSWSAQVLNFCIIGGNVSGNTTDFNQDVTNNDTPAACTATQAGCALCPNEACSDILPIQLLSFEVEAGPAPKLIWITLSELNNDYFSIQRSRDGREFKEIARIPTKGNTDARQDYAYTDLNALPGINYYRFEQFDLDGSSSFSPVRAAQVPFKSNYTVYPTLVNDRIRVILSNTIQSNSVWEIFDLSGRPVFKGILTAGTPVMEISLEGLASGSYTLRLQSEQASHIQKLVKMQ